MRASRYRPRPVTPPAEPVIELYSVPDAARLFGLTESRLRYWIQAGIVRPAVRQRGRFYYTFADLVGIKAAVELFGAGVSQERVRVALESLRRALPAPLSPTSRLRVCSDGESLEVVDDDAIRRPADPAALLMAFAVSSLGGQIAEKLPDRGTDGGVAAAALAGEHAAAPMTMIDAGAGATEPHQLPSAYQSFLDGCRAEDCGDLDHAEVYYRHAIEREPSLASAHTNLGNLAYRRGERVAARMAYQRALELDPDQPEARYNLANLLDETGDTELAIAELRQVCSRHPGFADAHYNLGLLLLRLGGVAQARQHLHHYVDLDATSAWASRARALMAP